MRFCCAVILLAAAAVSSCGDGNPTTPSGAVGIGCREELDGYQCEAQFVTSVSNPGQDVSGLATWSTSDRNIATVNTVGFVTVHRSGSVAIRASYRGAEGFTTLQVEPGGLRRYYRALSGFVTDLEDGSKITGATVRIVAGPNADRTTSTDISGAYQLYDLALGTFVVQFSKPGYATLDGSFTLTGDRFNDFSVKLARSSR